MLIKDPKKRITPAEILNHAYFKKTYLADKDNADAESLTTVNDALFDNMDWREGDDAQRSMEENLEANAIRRETQVRKTLKSNDADFQRLSAY